jgi:hypothetical protein
VNSYKIKKASTRECCKNKDNIWLLSRDKKIKIIKKVFKYLKKTMVCLTTLILLLKKKTINNGISEYFYPKEYFFLLILVYKLKEKNS